MALQRLTPEGLFKPTAYTQVVVASGRRMVLVSGQARQVYANLRADLPAATLVGVQALAEPGYLLEVEAIAVID